MSSTFALPNTLLGTVRLTRLRRRPAGGCPITSAPTRTVQDAPVVVALEPVAGGNRPSAPPLLPAPSTWQPSTWQLAGHRPVSYLDHVAVAPVGVLAITTRHHSAADDDEHVQRAWHDIRTAKGAAKLLELTLGDDSVEVRPVLVLTGPGAPELEHGYLLVKGVVIIDPTCPERWSHLFDAPAMDEIKRASMVERLDTLRIDSNDMPMALAN